MAKRKVFIPHLNCFGEEVDMKLTVKSGNYDAFLEVFDVETLEKLLKTQIEVENYEMAELVKKHIQAKKGGDPIDNKNLDKPDWFEIT